MAGTVTSAAVHRTLLGVLILNGVVAGTKLVIGMRTGALTVVGAGLESALDLLNNVIALAVVAIARREPDEEHPYGHEKFETLGALAVVGFLSISCFELLRAGTESIVTRRALPASAISGADFGVLAGTLLINAVVVVFETRRGRRLRSSLLLADAAHTRTDIFVTLLAIASLWFSRRGIDRVDGALAIVVAVVIAWTGWQILRVSIPVLVDQHALDSSEIRVAAKAVPGVLEVRTVRSRTSASQSFAEITIAVSGGASVAEAHALADAVEEAVAKRLGGGHVTVHVEPA